LKQQLSRLEAYLSRHGSDGKGWNDYLHLQELRLQLKTPAKPDAAALLGVLRRFRANYPTLDLPQFAETAAALNDYLHVARTQANADLQSDTDRRLELLAEETAKLTSPPNPESLARITAVVSWLERRWQAGPVVQAIRGRFSHPNLHVRVAGEFVAAASSRAIDETAPVHDNILGTSINGSGRTLGHTHVRLAPRADRAAFDLVIEGVNRSDTVGRNGPAIIFASGVTILKGTKRITLDDRGLHLAATSANAETSSHVDGVASTKCGLMDRIIKKIAWKQIPKQKAEGDCIAAAHAERQFGDRVDAEAAEQIAEANRLFATQFRNPLLRRGEFPKLLELHTDASALHLTVAQETIGKLAAPRPAPEIEGAHAIDVRLHESTIVNLAAGLLAGRTIRQEDVEKQALEVFGKIPEGLHDDEKGPWSITFAQRDPVALKMAGDSVELTVRAEGFTSEGSSLEGMDITVRYALAREGLGFKAVRQGDPEVLPPNHLAGNPIPVRLNSLRALLKERFSKLFPAEFVSPGLKFEGKLAHLGTLPISHLSIDAGWLAIAWRMDVPPATTLAASAP
jgi:hypothetical protein